MEEKEVTVLGTNYKPGRTVEELEDEHLINTLKTSHEERFKRLMQLIRLSEKMERARIEIFKTMKRI